ncbi:MAG: lipopolysaccharide kinase InaA family protein [Coraliomargarita sp.]
MFKVETLNIASEWHEALDAAGLLDIEAVTQRDFDWFEAPNKRRGGWSGVTRIVLNPDAPKAAHKAVFLKIQQNHFYVALNTGFRKRLTFERENTALKALQAFTSDIPPLLLHATWQSGKDRGAIIITEAIDDYMPLDQWLKQNSTASEPAERLDALLEALANSLRHIHANKWAHFGLFSKHVFIRKTPQASERIKLIDFEKTRKCWSTHACAIEDCSRFLRHTKELSRDSQLHFLKAYFQTDTFSPQQQRLIGKMRGAPQL